MRTTIVVLGVRLTQSEPRPETNLMGFEWYAPFAVAFYLIANCFGWEPRASAVLRTPIEPKETK